MRYVLRTNRGFRILGLAALFAGILFVAQAGSAYAQSPCVCPQFFLGEDSDPQVFIYWAEYHNDEGSGSGQCGHEADDLFYHSELLDENSLPTVCNINCLPGGARHAPTCPSPYFQPRKKRHRKNRCCEMQMCQTPCEVLAAGAPKDDLPGTGEENPTALRKPKLNTVKIPSVDYEETKNVPATGKLIKFDPGTGTKIVAKIFVVKIPTFVYDPRGDGTKTKEFFGKSLGIGRQILVNSSATPDESNITNIKFRPSKVDKAFSTVTLDYHGITYRIAVRS